MNVYRYIQEFGGQLRAFERSAKLFLLATVLQGIVSSAWMLFFNFYILERGFGRDFLGLANAMPAVAALIFGIPLGALSDRIGRKPAMILGMGGIIASYALIVIVRDPTMILVMSFLAGISVTLFYLSQAPFMMKVSRRDTRTLLFSLNFGLMTLSGAVGSLFAGQLPAIFGSLLGVSPRSAEAYQAVLLASVLLSGLTLIPIFMLKEPRTTGGVNGQKAKRAPIWRVVMRSITLKLALPNLLVGLGAAILIPYMNVFFLDRFALPDRQLGVLFSLSALLTGVGSVIAPRLATGLGSKIRAVVLTQSISLVFLLMLGFSPVLWLAGISFLIRGTLMNMASPLYHAFAMEQIDESEQGTVNSVFELAWQVGWAVGPYISGVVQESYGFTPLFIATGILYFISTLLIWLLFKQVEFEGGTVIEPEPSVVSGEVLGN
jgi:MFS family permease